MPTDGPAEQSRETDDNDHEADRKHRVELTEGGKNRERYGSRKLTTAEACAKGAGREKSQSDESGDRQGQYGNQRRHDTGLRF